MNKLSEKQMIIISSVIVFLIVLIYIFLQFRSNDDIVINSDFDESQIIDDIQTIDIGQSEETQLQENTENVITEEPKILVVYICGQVKNPGVYELEDGSRINDAIEKAGGYLEQADIAKLNFACKVSDGEKIYLPKVGENVQNDSLSSSFASSYGSSSNYKSLININNCSANDLDKLPGVGPSTANKIIDYRNKNGLFKSIEQLKEVSGIGDKKFDEIKGFITI